MEEIQLKLTEAQAKELLGVLGWVSVDPQISIQLRKALNIPEPPPSLMRWENGLWDRPNCDPNACHASRDGECLWARCPAAPGVGCPLDRGDEDLC